MRMLPAFRYMLPSSYIGSLVLSSTKNLWECPVDKIMHILGHSLLVKDDSNNLLKPSGLEAREPEEKQLYFDFKFD